MVVSVPRPSSAQHALDTEAAIGGEALLRGDFSKAVANLTTELDAKGLNDEQRARLFNDRGVARWRLGELASALEDFNQAATLLPEFAAVYNNRGNALLALQSPNEASRDFDRAILLVPAYAAAYNNRAIAEVQLDKTDAALADFAKAAELAQNAPAPINGRGKLHLDLGRPYLALRDFSRAIAIEPSYRPAYRNRALTRIALQQYSVAIDEMTNALTFAPNDPSLLLTRALAQTKSQNYAVALADLDKLVAATPKSAPALAERGHVRALLGSFPEAMDDFSKAIEIDPKSRDAFVYRSEAHLANKEPDLGLADAERALKIDQNYGHGYVVRGDIEEMLGQKPQAIADFERAAESDNDDQDAWAGLKRLTGKDKPAPDPLPGAQVSGWQMAMSGDKLLAIRATMPDLLVPLERLGTDPAQLTGWEERGPPFKGIGVLRYSAGQIQNGSTQEAAELAVIIDLVHRQVIGIEPYKIGDRAATWTWTDGGELIVKGPDGVSSSFRLGEALATRPDMNRSTAQFPARTTSASTGQSASAPAHKKKGFTLFDLFFN